MIEKEVEIENDIGLHSKPATYFVKKAKQYRSSIQLIKGEEQADAKNLLEILSLGIIKNDKIKISAIGVDEEEAIEDLINILKNLGQNYG